MLHLTKSLHFLYMLTLSTKKTERDFSGERWAFIKTEIRQVLSDFHFISLGRNAGVCNTIVLSPWSLKIQMQNNRNLELKIAKLKNLAFQPPASLCKATKRLI